MQIVINISENLYKATINGLDANEIWDLRLAVKNGTPLPKGHGRLIDETKIKNCGWNFIKHHAKTDAPTIIQAEGSDAE